MDNNLRLGVNPTGIGSYDLSGTASLLRVLNDETIGVSGTGTFNQTGGTHLVLNNLYLGFNPGGTGSYNLRATASWR